MEENKETLENQGVLKEIPKVLGSDEFINLKVQVQVLKSRLDNVDGDLTKLKDTVQSGFAELKDMFLAYKHRNHVTEFLHDNWKWVVLLISLGVGEPAVKILQTLAPVLFK